MLPLEDALWAALDGGYRIPFDARPLLQGLRDSREAQPAWDALWGELHHQGDIGQASFAVVPHLVEIYKARRDIDWNPYGFVATVEVLRSLEHNPEPLPEIVEGYERAIESLAEYGLQQLPHATEPETIRAILSVLAVWKGLKTYAEVLIDFSEDEVAELKAAAFGDDEDTPTAG